jgi:hypothetical protein
MPNYVLYGFIYDASGFRSPQFRALLQGLSGKATKKGLVIGMALDSAGGKH